jgi:hypothetical protein
MGDLKSIWKSKTFWFNGLALIVLIAAGFGFEGDIKNADPEVVALAGGVVALINLALRMYTTQPIETPGRLAQQADRLSTRSIGRTVEAADLDALGNGQLPSAGSKRVQRKQ